MMPRKKPLKAAPPASKTSRDNPDQSKLFLEKAREIGADEDKSAADGLIGTLAKTPPEPRKPKN